MHLLEIPRKGGAKPVAAQVLRADLSSEPAGCWHGTPASLLPGHAGITQAVLLSGSSPALLPNYQITKRPCEALLEKNVLEKLNLTQSQKHSLGFMTQRSGERCRAKNQISSLPCSRAFTAWRDQCAGKDGSGVGRVLLGGQDWGLK